MNQRATRSHRWWLSLVVMMLSAVCAADESSQRLSIRALQTLRHIPIQHNGRVKPFDSFARETLATMTGSPRLGRAEPVDTVLSIIAEPERWQAEPLIDIPFMPLREALGMDRKAARISYNDLIASRKLMRMLPGIMDKQQRSEKLSMLETEALDAFQRFVAFSNLIEQRLALVPSLPNEHRGVWGMIGPDEGDTAAAARGLREAWVVLLSAVRRADAREVETAATNFNEGMSDASPAHPPIWRLRLEVAYNRLEPFGIARWFYILGVIGLIVGLGRNGARAASLGLGACWGAFILHGAGILTRVVIGGRPPVSNFYETMLWLPFVAVLLSLLLEHRARARYVALAAGALAAITLTLAEHVPLDASITPVVAVLRSNKWLAIHVLTIVASYGALALATGLAHVYGWLYLRRAGRAPLAQLDGLLYHAIQIGVVLLAGGIMLGAVWANASWGRYWGWDPKETWALITLLWFLAILHGRFAGWLSGIWVALSTIGGFFLLLMTYYGVSFYLVGLHSYAGGHAKPLPVLLVVYLIAELTFLIVVAMAATRRHPA